MSFQTETKRLRVVADSPAHHGWRKRILHIAFTILLAGPITGAMPALASAKAHYCFPKDINPLILRSPNANDYAPNWAPPSGVGTGWSLTRLGRHGRFLKGILNTSHGNPTTGIIYVIAAQWDCQ